MSLFPLSFSNEFGASPNMEKQRLITWTGLLFESGLSGRIIGCIVPVDAGREFPSLLYSFALESCRSWRLENLLAGETLESCSQQPNTEQNTVRILENDLGVESKELPQSLTGWLRPKDQPKQKTNTSIYLFVCMYRLIHTYAYIRKSCQLRVGIPTCSRFWRLGDIMSQDA